MLTGAGNGAGTLVVPRGISREIVGVERSTSVCDGGATNGDIQLPSARSLSVFRHEEARCKAAGIISEVPMHK
jgi:hypothetical protein